MESRPERRVNLNHRELIYYYIYQSLSQILLHYLHSSLAIYLLQKTCWFTFNEILVHMSFFYKSTRLLENANQEFTKELSGESRIQSRLQCLPCYFQDSCVYFGAMKTHQWEDSDKFFVSCACWVGFFERSGQFKLIKAWINFLTWKCTVRFSSNDQPKMRCLGA